MVRTSVTGSLLGALVFVPILGLASCSDTPEDAGATPGADGGPDTSATTKRPDADTLVDAGPPDALPDAPPTAESELESTYCKPSAALICTRAQACDCGALLPGGALDVSACTARLSAQCMAAWGPFLTAGAKVDKTAAAACIAKLDATTPACGAPSGTVVFAACDPFAIDPAKMGEACTTPYCAGGSGRCVEGTCTAAGVAETECQDQYRCASGYVCSPIKGTCVAQGTAGTACDVNEECAPHLACIDHVCNALGVVGAACNSVNECANGLICANGICAAAPTTCVQGSDCGQGQSCGGPRTCIARLGVGETCSEDRDCEAALYCDDVAHTCTARPALNAPCARGTVCAVGLGCSGDNGTCLALPGQGQACAVGDTLCAGDLGCNDFTCGPMPAVGEPCTTDFRCAAGLGCDFAPEGSVCIVPRAAGEPCPSDRSCAASLHCGGDGVCVADRPAGAFCGSSGECAGVCAPDTSGGFSCRAQPAAGDSCLVGDDCPETLRCGHQARKCIAEVCSAL